MAISLQDLYLGDALATALYHTQDAGPTGEVAYIWDTRTKRYRDRVTGQFLDSTDIRASLESVINGVKQELDDLAEQAANGAMDPGIWRDQMEAQITVLHQTAALVADGGMQAQDVRSLALMAERIRDELNYLDGFAEDIVHAHQEGERPYTEAETSARADQYARAAVPTYEAARQQAVMDDPNEQYDVGRRVLMPEADHCVECVVLGAEDGDLGGYIPVDKIVPIGATPCRSNCQCAIEYARSDTLHPDQYTL